MRHAVLVAFAGLLIVALLVGINAPAATPVQAHDVLQGMPRLDGMKIYFTESGEEASRFDRSPEGLSRLAGLLEMLGADLHTLEWRNGIPTDADLVIIAGPKKDLTGDQAAWLWSYLQDGEGRLLLLAEPQTPTSKALSRNAPLMDLMWVDFGITAENEVVAQLGDVRTIVPTPRPVRGDDPTNTPAPPFESPALITDFVTGNLAEAHPITNRLSDELAFFTARPLAVDATLREAEAMVLAFSDTAFYGETSYNEYLSTNAVAYNVEEDAPPGSLPLAVAYDNPVLNTRIVMVGDGDFARNGTGFQTSPPYSASFLYPGNVRFMLNAVTWLLDVETVDLTFPTPGPTTTPTTTPTSTPTPEPAADGGEGQ